MNSCFINCLLFLFPGVRGAPIGRRPTEPKVFLDFAGCVWAAALCLDQLKKALCSTFPVVGRRINKVPLMNMNRKSKPWWEIRLEIQIKKISDNKYKCQEKEKKSREFVGIKRGKQRSKKTKSTARVDKSERTRERKKIQKVLRQGQTIQAKPDIIKQWKKIWPASRWRMYEDIPTTGC